MESIQVARKRAITKACTNFINSKDKNNLSLNVSPPIKVNDVSETPHVLVLDLI